MRPLTTYDPTHERPTLGKKLTIHFPDSHKARVDQDEEWCEIATNGTRRRVRFHDYHEIYTIPGLYEHIFYDKLECISPQVVRSLLEEEVRKDGLEPSELSVLDVGAGNGMVGEELADMGATELVGVDIIAEAAEAAERDRPHVYDDYYVADLTQPDAETRRELGEKGFNCLTTVAALGFGDIPPLAFAEAYNYVETPGWAAFNIKEDFLDHRDSTGFSRLIRRMLDEGALEHRAQRHYRHRLSLAGDPLHYVAMVAVKRGDVPMEWVEDAEAAGA